MHSPATSPTRSQLLCPLCGSAHHIPDLDAGQSAQCVRCDTVLMRNGSLGGDAALAFTLTGILLAGPATLLPFVEVSKIQAARTSYIFSSVRALWEAGMHPLAILIFLCGLILPFLVLGTLAAVLLPARLGWTKAAPGLLVRAARALEHWAMPEVQMLAVLVAFAKLGSLVHVRPGPGLWCYAAMAGCTLLASRSFALGDAPRLLTLEPHTPGRESGWEERLAAARLSRSRGWTAALALSAAVMLVPANLIPVIHLESPGNTRTDTIYSSIVGLVDQGLWPLGAIVFTASFLVPFLKLGGLGWLLFATRRPGHRRARGFTRLFAALDFIGRWSMLDVFLVAFLSGAVRFGVFATVEPRPGLIAFAAAVVLTMLATDAFDPHLLWSRSPARAGEATP